MKKQRTMKLKNKLRRKAPAAGIILGIVTGIGAAVLACHKARKMDEQLSDLDAEIAKTKEELENTEEDSQEHKEAKGRLTGLKIKRFGRCLKIFAIPIGIGVISIGCSVGSFKVVAADLAATSAFAKKLDNDFNSYRQATRERYGDAVDRELRFATHQKEKVVQSVDEETGEIKEETKTVTSADAIKLSPYAIPFCRTYCGDTYKDNPYYDMNTIRNAMNDLDLEYKAYGVARLETVYKSLNYDVTKDAIRAGYINDTDGPATSIPYTITEATFDFTTDENGEPIYENGYIIDFPTARDILDEIPAPRRKQ